MKKRDYYYAVGRIRVHETALLDAQEFEQLLRAPTTEDALVMLRGKGLPFDGPDYETGLAAMQTDAAALLKELLGGDPLLDALYIQYDFQNVKCALKAVVTGKDGAYALTDAGVYPARDVYDAVLSHEFDRLPDLLAAPARDAYQLMVDAGSAQRADSLLDRECLRAMLSESKKSGSGMMTDVCETIAALRDIAILDRCIRTGRSYDFRIAAVCPVGGLDAEALAEISMQGQEAFLAALESTPYAACAAQLRSGTVAFEKYCDDRLIELCEAKRLTGFAEEPLIVYALAHRAQEQSLRILLSCKRGGAPEETIRERMRKLYV